jgi:hypothetical protein
MNTALYVLAALLAVGGFIAVAVVAVGARKERQYEAMRHGEDPWQR